MQSVFPLNSSMERWVTGHTCRMQPGVGICTVPTACAPTDGWRKDFVSFCFIWFCVVCFLFWFGLLFLLITQEQSKPSCQQCSECRAFSNKGVTLITV